MTLPFIIKPLEAEYIDALVQMEHAAWHEYYQQYPIYALIKDSVTIESLTADWHEFISEERDTSGPLITGQDRKAYIALLEDETILGVGAVSAYKEQTWPEVDALLQTPEGAITKTAKFQNLYINHAHRGSAVGHYLGVVRADYMLEKGYEACFLTTYLDADKTTKYHLKNGMELVHHYESKQTYGPNQERATIGCFLNKDLRALRDTWQAYIDTKQAAGKAYKLVTDLSVF